MFPALKDNALQSKRGFLTNYREIIDLPQRLFVVGDIHGCSEESAALVEHIRTEEGLAQDDMLVFVGDYIDRGPRSKEVVGYLIEIQKEFPRTVFLRGNHEDMLLSFMGFESGRLGSSYLANGGLQTLQSYGFFSEMAPEECLHRMPKEHIDFFQGLERFIVVGNVVVVHAGLNPLVDLENQADQDLFWIRDEFIVNLHYFGKTVVFGHTPYRDIVFDLPYKIGIDTGLVYGNKISAIELVNGEVFQVVRGNRKVEISSVEKKGGQKVALAEKKE